MRRGNKVAEGFGDEPGKNIIFLKSYCEIKLNRNIYIPEGIILYLMEQKCSYLKVLEVFFIEPTTVHFIKEISRKIKLAPTSTRNYIKDLLSKNLIAKKKAKPFDGFIANRENEDFIFYKRVYNLYSLKELTAFLVSTLWPKLIVVFGSYARGEDVEGSDIDILMISKVRKKINLEKFEKKLKRKINLLIIDKLEKLDKNIIKKIYNGTVLYGGF